MKKRGGLRFELEILLKQNNPALISPTEVQLSLAELIHLQFHNGTHHNSS